MIVPLDMARAIPAFSELDNDEIRKRLKGLEIIERRIRSITHNQFTNRKKRVHGCALGGVFAGTSPYFAVDDRVLITMSGINDGLYDVLEVTDDIITLDRPLYDADYVRITRVEYPLDVIEGMISLQEWDEEGGSKGIVSETISRHSVTYESAATGQAGYPTSLISFISPYMKARF